MQEKRRRNLGEVDPEELEFREVVADVVRTFEERDCARLAYEVRRFRLFVDGMESDPADFDPKAFIVKMLPAIVAPAPANLVIEMLMLVNKMFEVWNMSDGYVLMRDGHLPEERLAELLSKENDEITREIMTLLSQMYNGDETVSKHIFGVLPLEMVQKLLHSNGKLYSECAVYLGRISEHKVPEGMRVAFAHLCYELVVDFNIDANNHGLFALGNLFDGHSPTAQQIVDSLPQLPGKLQEIIEAGDDERPKWVFRLMSQMALSCCSMPGYSIDLALKCLSHPQGDAARMALLAVYHMLLNRGSQQSEDSKISDDKLYDCIQRLLDLSLSAPYALRYELLTIIPELVTNHLPEHYYHKLVSHDFFLYLAHLCDGDALESLEILNPIMSLLTHLFLRAQSENWDAEYHAAFTKSLGVETLESWKHSNSEPIDAFLALLQKT